MYHKSWATVRWESGITARRSRPLRHSLGDIKTRKSGWSYQKVYGDNNDGLNTGYWKIRNPEGRTVDRALTAAKALKIIREKERETLT